MPATDVRNVLLRAMFDPDFHNILLTNPDVALQEYSLTAEEQAALAKPGAELYQYLQERRSSRGARQSAQQLRPTNITPPPPPTTITVIIIVAITVFVTAVAPGPNDLGVSGSAQQFQALLDAIRTSSGQQRFDLVRTLVNELTKGQ